MYRTNARSRAPGAAMNGSAAINGAARIRPAVIVFGRFITRSFSEPLGERLKHQLAHGLQRVEHTVTVHRNRLEVGRFLDPLAAGYLFNEVLPGVVRIRLDAVFGRVFDFPARIESSLEILDRRGVRQVPLVVLDHERHLGEVVSVLGHVVVEVLHRLQVGFHPLGLGIADEHYAIYVLEYQLAAGVVVDLTGHGEQVKTRLEAANRAEANGKEIEEEGALRLRRQRYEFSSRLRLNLAVDVLEIRSFSAEPGTIVNDLTIDLARSVVDHRHV